MNKATRGKVEIRLYGKLSKWGKVFKFSVTTPRHALSGLITQIPGLKAALRSGYYGMVICEGLRKGHEIGLEEVDIQFGKTRVFHLVPIINGRGGGRGFLKVALGVTLLAVGLFGGFAAGAFVGAAGAAFSIGATTITWGAITALGVSMTLAGVSSLLAPRIDVGSYGDREQQKQSFLFNGAINATEQGQPVPLVYGHFRVGSVVASGGIEVRDI